MGNTNETGALRRCPPLPADRSRIPDYEMTGKAPGHDGEPPEFRDRKDHVYMDGRREATLSPENVNHSRVKRMKEHKQITPRQFDAADRHERDWELAQIQPIASSVLVGAGGGSDMHPNDSKRAAMRRRGEAMAACGRLYPMIELVVLNNMSVGKACGQLGIHVMAGTAILRMGLDTLADHFGLPTDQPDRR